MRAHSLVAVVTPMDTPHGYNWTFGFPMILFLVIAAALYLLLFARPHRRVPARRVTLPAGTSVPPQRPAPEASSAETAADTTAEDSQ